jgi:hypothetical protein
MLIILFFIILFASAYAISQTSAPGSCGGSWTTCTNAHTDNTNTASVGGSSTVGIKGNWSGFGFSIPAGSTINSINITIKGHGVGHASNDVIFRLWNHSGSNFLADHTVDYTTTTCVPYSFNVYGDNAWKWQDINNLQVQIENTGGGGTPSGRYWHVCYINISIDYTANNAPNATPNSPQNNTLIAYASSVLLNVTYKDGDGTAGTVVFVNNSNNVALCTNNSVASGANVTCGVPSKLGEFKWYANASDGAINSKNGIWNYSMEPPTMSYSISYPSSGCSEGDGCTTPGCTACTYCSLKFPSLPIQAWNCTGQTNGAGFFVVSNDGGADIDIEAKVNQTLTEAYFWLSLASNPYDATAKIINNGYQTITNTKIPPAGSEEIWGFGNATASVLAGNYSINLTFHSI